MIHEQTTSLAAPLVIGVGLALLARLLFKPKKPNQVLADDKPNTAHLRGSFIPLVIGTRRVGAVILWVGSREIDFEEEDVGGKGLGGGSSVKKRIYYEKAVHALCVGPGAKITGIYRDGTLIPGSEGLTSLNTPSGTAVTFAEFGTARIYWGELNQDTSDLFTDKLGIDTAAPYIVRVEWDRARLGDAPRWPILEYVVSVPGNMAQNQPVGTPTDSLGVNPATVLWQIWTAKYPHGAGFPTDWVNFDGFTDLGDVCETDDIWMNLLVQDGDPVDRVTSELMQDAGFLLPECEGQITPFPIRKYQDTLEVLDDDLLLPPIDEIERVHISAFGNALVYEYNDRDQNYHTATIDVDDDTTQGIRNQRRTKKIQLTTVTSRAVASRIANRRQVEDLDDPVRIKVTGTRNLRAVQPGQPFSLPGVGTVRVIGKKLSFSDPSVELELLKDVFDHDITDVVDPDIPGGAVEGDLKPDLRFKAIELTFLATGGESNRLVCLRIRNNQSIFAATVYVSSDNATYYAVGSQSAPATGGLLQADWTPNQNLWLVEDGPLVTIDENDDETLLPENLSADLDAWYGGYQIMVVNDELLYVREFVQVSGTTYQALGCIRMRLQQGSAESIRYADQPQGFPEHSEGDECYIISRTNLSLLTHTLIDNAAVQYVKAVPVNDQGMLPIAAVAPDMIEMQSRGTRTPPIAWIVCGGNHNLGGIAGRRDFLYNSADLGEDIVFEFVPASTSAGAGTGGFGQPMAVEAPTGTVIFEVYMDEDLVDLDFGELPLVATHTFDLADLDHEDGVFRWAYTAAQQAADFPSNYGFPFSDGTDLNPKWEILVYHDNGTRSEPVRVRPRYFDSYGTLFRGNA